MRVLFTIIFLTFFSIFSSAQLIYKMNMRVQIIESIVERTFIDTTSVVWGMYEDTVHILYNNTYLKFYKLSNKDISKLDYRTKLLFRKWNDRPNERTFILRNEWGEVHIVRLIMIHKCGSVQIFVNNYSRGGVPSYYFFLLPIK